MTLRVTLQRSDDDIAARFGSLKSRADVAELLEVPEDFLKKILYFRKEPRSYRHFSIRKRSGGSRRISIPPPNLSILQSKLNYVFQLVYRKKPSVHGFVRGRSILTNANPHVGKRWVLNVDIENFFPSIHFGRVRGMLISPPYKLGPSAATVIAQICCSEDGLPQGAPSSPMLSNMVCGRMDGELGALAHRWHAKYSRYGDDITFSLRQRDFPEELAIAPVGWVGTNVVIGPALAHVVVSNGFKINGAKSRLQLSHCRQEVTGIGVNVFPNINRDLVREVRAMLYKWERYGEDAAEREYQLEFAKPSRRPHSAPSSFRRALKGKLDFIQMVRGRADPVYVKLRAKLHRLDPDFVPPAPAPLPRSGLSVRGVGSDPGWTRWYHRSRESIFHLEVETENRISSGTAFAFRTGELATAAHNLVGKVRLQHLGKSVELSAWDCHELYQSQGIDCALIHFDHGAPLLAVSPTLPAPGEPLAVVGYASVPRRLPTIGVYPGAVESISPDYRGVPHIQITVPSAGGLSGSPVINRAGQVVGVVVESTFEQTLAGVPSREFCSVLPVEFLSAVRRHK